MKLNSILDINEALTDWFLLIFCDFKPLLSDLKIAFLHFGVNRHNFLVENG